MSATINLYRLSDAEFQNQGLYSIPIAQIKEMSDDEFDALWETRDTDRWKDGECHELIDIAYYLHQYGNTKGWRRVKDRFDTLPVQYGVIDGNNDVRGYIVADHIACYDGCVLKNKFFKKETTLSICTTKEEVESFFKQYGNPDCKWTYDDIISKWDEDMFLIVAY
jgi:hypothetical protein